MATARRWAIEHWDRPPGVPSVIGLEPYHMLRPFVRKLTFPYARFDIGGVEHVPARGPVLLASNHRSYFDVAALALVAREIGRPVRFLGKKEIFDAPVVGTIARAIGGISVDRGSGSDQPLRDAEAALKAGEVVIVLPQGTIPRGRDFFDPRAARQDGDGPPGRRHRRHGRAGRVVGHREGVAPLGAGARLHAGAQAAHGARPGGQARGTVPHRRQGGHRDHHGGHQRVAAARVEGAPRADGGGAGPHQAASVRAQLARATTRAVNAASRRLGRGQGTVAGGRAGLRVDPRLLEHLSAGRQVVLVTGTNGKTTTTRLATVGLGAAGDAVVSNETGSNMPPGHVAALAGTAAARAPSSRWTRSTCRGS